MRTREARRTPSERLGASAPSPRRAVAVLVVALLLALLCSPFAQRLQPRAELTELLPERSPEASAYRDWLTLFGGAELTYVMIEATGTLDPEPGSRDAEESRPGLLELAESAATRLAEAPGVAWVRSGLDEEDERLLLDRVVARAPLYLSDEQFPDALVRRLEPSALAARAQLLAQKLRLPGQEVERELARHDPLGLFSELGSFDLEIGGPSVDPLSGLFVSSDGNAALVLVATEASELNPEAGRDLNRTLDEIAAEIAARSAGQVRLVATGGPLYAARDEQLFREDLRRTLSTSVLACTAVLALCFGGWRELVVVALPVALALYYTVALLELSGGVTALGLGFATVLVGLGLDYGIHLTARHRDEIERGGETRSLSATLQYCGPALLASALTTAGAFLVLTGAHLPLLADVGRVVAIGIVVTLGVTWFVGAAMLSLLRPGISSSTLVWRPLGVLVDGTVAWAARSRRLVLGAALGLTAIALVGLPRLDLDADPRSLRPAGQTFGEAESAIGSAFGIGFGTAVAVVEGPTLDEALAHAEGVAATLRAAALDGLSVSSPTDLLLPATRVEERLRVLESLGLSGAVSELERQLDDAGLPPAAFAPGLEALEALLDGRDPDPLDTAALPPWLARQLHPGDPTAVALLLRSEKEELLLAPLDELLSDSADVAVASTVRVGRALRQTAADDTRRLALIAAGIVLLVVLSGFRFRIVPSLTALLPAGCGLLWALGIWGFVDGRIDLLAVSVVPIVLGLGIDDGLHAVHGARSVGSQLLALRLSGRAMVLTTLTTAVAFAALGTSAIPALQRAGALVALAVVLCLSVTLTVIPALRTPAEEGGA